MSQLAVKIEKPFRLAGARKFQLSVEFVAGAGVTVLFGPSGSGKTSILDCVAGLISPDEGSIHLDDATLFDSTEHVNMAARHRNVGYVFQSAALFPNMTVLENVAFGGQSTSDAQQWLERFRVAHLSAQRPNELSGGEKQRVALARTLATRPKALLLDEPLSGLDDRTKFALIDDLHARTAEARILVLYVTHAIEEVFLLGERVIVLEEGKIAKQGSPREVLAEEKQRLVAALV